MVCLKITDLHFQNIAKITLPRFTLFDNVQAMLRNCCVNVKMFLKMPNCDVLKTLIKHFVIDYGITYVLISIRRLFTEITDHHALKILFKHSHAVNLFHCYFV